MSPSSTVRRVITILEYLAEARKPEGVTEISRNLAMHKSTVYRFLSSLAEQGYVQKDHETGRYSLGARAAWLGARFLESREIRGIARPILEELAQETLETIHLGIENRNEVVYIDKIESRRAVQMRSRVGFRQPLHSTGLGKALLASFPESRWRQYVTDIGLRRHTPSTIVEPEAFCAHLRQIRKQGYSIDNVENEDGIRCLAAPIRDHSGQTVAAFSISGSTLTMTLERIDSLVPLARKAALAISKRLGFTAANEHTEPYEHQLISLASSEGKKSVDPK